MKKILEGVLVILSVLLVGNLKAETLDEPGTRDITPTIGEIDGAGSENTYEISLSWDDFVYDYNMLEEDSYVWNGNPAIHVINDSTVPVSANFSWTPEISGVGMLMNHMNASCTELTDPDIIDLISEGKVYFYSDSSCTVAEQEYDSNETYYYFNEGEESWYDSLTSGTTFYNNYYHFSGQGTANGLLNSKEFIIMGHKLFDNNNNIVWAPTYYPDFGVEFHFSLADMQRARDINTLTEGATIGTLTITISDVD